MSLKKHLTFKQQKIYQKFFLIEQYIAFDYSKNFLINNWEKSIIIYNDKKEQIFKVQFQLLLENKVKQFNNLTVWDIRFQLVRMYYKIFWDATCVCNNNKNEINNEYEIKNEYQQKILKKVVSKYGKFISCKADGYCLYRSIFYYYNQNKTNQIDNWLIIFYDLFALYLYYLIHKSYKSIGLILQKLNSSINGDSNDIKLLAEFYRFNYIVINIPWGHKNNNNNEIRIIDNNFDLKNKEITKYCVFICLNGKVEINGHWLFISVNNQLDDY